MVRDEVSQSARSSIAGGFVLASVASLMACWRACQSDPLGIGDFRAWLACHEIRARRCLAEEGRAVAFTIAELAKLLGVSEKRARASVRRLVAAGLLEWSDSAVGFPTPGLEDPELKDTIGRGRGPVAIPRRMLRFLIGGARPALVAAVLGILLRCLSCRKDGFDGWGRVKASWIAHVFGVELRRVKQARAELVELGWIVPEESDQWTMNRHGKAYRIDLGWSPPASPQAGSRLAPPPPDPGSRLAPPDLDQDLSQRERNRNQEPCRGPSGVCVQGSGDGEKTLPKPTLNDVRIEDLKDTGRLLDLLGQAIGRGFVGPSEADRLKFVAVAEHALAIGKENPPGLFAYLIRGACWRYVTQADEDRANARIKAFLRGPEPEPTARASASRTPLSDDARAVREYHRAFAAARYPGDPFPQVRRHDPSWTRERWDAALAELGQSSFGSIPVPWAGF
jgi:hypothetical protein